MTFDKVNKYSGYKGANHEATIMYDAHEQQYLDIKNLDLTTLIWMQVHRLGQISCFDPKAGGKEMLIQVGGGNNAIIEKKYIPHSFSMFYYGVMHLFNLLVTDFDRLPDEPRVKLQKTWRVLQDCDESSRDAYKLSSKLFRDCLRVIRDYYNGGEALIDEVNPEVAKRVMADKEKARLARQAQKQADVVNNGN